MVGTESLIVTSCRNVWFSNRLAALLARLRDGRGIRQSLGGGHLVRVPLSRDDNGSATALMGGLGWSTQPDFVGGEPGMTYMTLFPSYNVVI